MLFADNSHTFLSLFLSSVEGSIVWSKDLVVLPESADWSCTQLSGTLDVDLTHTGLNEQNGPQMKLFLRQACIDLVDFLTDDKDKRVCLISGCRGVGKSVEVFSYTSWLAKKKKMRYLYIHANDFDGVHIIFKEKKNSSNVRVGRIRKVPEDFNHLKNLILDSLEKKIMIVLDGAL